MLQNQKSKASISKYYAVLAFTAVIEDFSDAEEFTFNLKVECEKSDYLKDAECLVCN